MSIFAKKTDADQGSRGDRRPSTSAGVAFGITEATQLLRSLPIDQNPELIVRVVRTTLESLDVHLSDIIADATRKEQVTEERFAAVQGQVADLEKQLAGLRQEIGALEFDLKETTDVKERLQIAEKGSGGAHGAGARADVAQTLPYGQHLPPPLPGTAR